MANNQNRRRPLSTDLPLGAADSVLRVVGRRLGSLFEQSAPVIRRRETRLVDDLVEVAQGDTGTRISLRPLPDDVVELLRSAHAPLRLAAHLRAVHDVAVAICNWLARTYPAVRFDADAVAFGAATHDIGKAIHPEELNGPGTQQEAAGADYLVRLGVPPHRARFAATHNAWDQPDIALDDLLVVLADKVWKGRRDEDAERRVLAMLENQTGATQWEIFSLLDDELAQIADSADERLAFQSLWPTSVP